MAINGSHKTGVWRGDEKSSMSHIIKDGKPWCKASIIPDTELVILSHGVNLDYVQCGICQRRWKARLKKGGES